MKKIGFLSVLAILSAFAAALAPPIAGHITRKKNEKEAAEEKKSRDE